MSTGKKQAERRPSRAARTFVYFSVKIRKNSIDFYTNICYAMSDF